MTSEGEVKVSFLQPHGPAMSFKYPTGPYIHDEHEGMIHRCHSDNGESNYNNI